MESPLDEGLFLVFECLLLVVCLVVFVLQPGGLGQSGPFPSSIHFGLGLLLLVFIEQFLSKSLLLGLCLHFLQQEFFKGDFLGGHVRVFLRLFAVGTDIHPELKPADVLSERVVESGDSQKSRRFLKAISGLDVVLGEGDSGLVPFGHTGIELGELAGIQKGHFQHSRVLTFRRLVPAGQHLGCLLRYG